YFFFFFFQAEDGIRDYKVTGVQTCALPISKECSIMISDIKMPKMTGIELSKYVKEARPELKFVIMSSMSVRKQEWRHIVPFTKRSEERRVGKECRYRGWMSEYKKKEKIVDI